MRLAQVMSWMEEHFRDPIRIEDLCERAHMARSTFHRTFEEIYGASPLDYLIGLRVEQARRLLTGTDLSIAAIAHRCGFSDGNYLTRQFRRRTGMSPRRFQQRQREVSAAFPQDSTG